MILLVTFNLCKNIGYMHAADSCGSIFTVELGGGGEVVYAPAGHNTTLTCAVRSITLLWEVNGFRFGDSMAELHERGIFQSQVMSSSLSIMNSTLSVFGSDANHEARICCLSRMSEDMPSLQMCCATLFVYGKFYHSFLTF